MRGHGHHHGEFGRGGDGRRMRRGRVPDLLLAALLDGPAHGYELMDRLEKFSGGDWRPSPGSVYPLLQAFEDRGLIKGHESEGRRVFTLTDAGREEADKRQVIEVAARFPSDSRPAELHAPALTPQAEVVAGCRVLGGQDVGDPVWGHVSLRDPEGRGVWMKAGPLGFDEVTSDDVVLIDFDGTAIAGTHRVPLEYPLHTEILRRREDLGSVVHAHPPYSIALGATGAELQAFSNAAGPFAAGVPRYTRPVGLIDTPELGAELADRLGAARAALMTGHGVVAAGTSVGAAVTTALLLERACQLQLSVASAGGLDPSLAEPGDRYRHTESEQYLLRTWEYLKRRTLA